MMKEAFVACAGVAGIEPQPFTHNIQYAGGGGFVCAAKMLVNVKP